jgi:hypothetical protein
VFTDNAEVMCLAKMAWSLENNGAVLLGHTFSFFHFVCRVLEDLCCNQRGDGRARFDAKSQPNAALYEQCETLNTLVKG